MTVPILHRGNRQGADGHTRHLLLSFPSHVPPEKAKLIAEVWAFEMFQSGEHQEDVWSYARHCTPIHTARDWPDEKWPQA